ncbi:MAG: hypothetical protein JOZ72_14915 [Alphaproteobacteria bacterium]|nr:hypothetical protein [Alphaproteobacteria bacterium]
MPDTIIPADVRDLLLNKIDSVAELEALLLLRKSADEDWTALGLARRLYVAESAAVELLARLAVSGFCVSAGGLTRYRPSDEELRRTVDRLAEAYARSLIAVTNLIHAKPSRIRQFADAFRFRREK